MGQKINLLEKVNRDNSSQFGQNDYYEKTLNRMIETYLHSFLKKHKWCALVVFILFRIGLFYSISRSHTEALENPEN